MSSTPRIWPSITLAIGAPLAAQVAAGVATAAVLIGIMVTDPTAVDLADPESFVMPPLLLAAVTALTMLTLAGITLGAGWLSPVALRERLGLLRGRFRLATLVPASLFGLALGQTSGSLAAMAFGPEAFAFLEPVFSAMADASFFEVLLVGAAIGIGPGVAEELLFRGYVQRRLLTRTAPVVAVSVTSLLFAASHLHPLHVLVVIPLAFYLGLLGWRSGSVLAPMVVHAFNNAVAIALVWLPDDVEPTTMLTWTVPLLLVSGVATVAFEPALRTRSDQSGRGMLPVPNQAR